MRATVLILLVVLVCCMQVKADVWPLVLTGDQIPNTANFRFAVFGPAVVNTSGTIAFHASFTDPSTNASGEGIFEIVGGQLIPVVMEGQALPDVPGSFFGGSGLPSINNSGDMVFWVATTERPQQKFWAIFEFSKGVLRRVVDFGTAVPGAPGESFSDFNSPQINDQGQIVFGADVTNPPGSNGPVQGGLFMVSSSGLNAVELDVAGSSQSVANTQSFSINNHGAIAYLATLPQPTGPPVGSINVASGNSTAQIVKFPQPVPNTSYTTSGTTDPPVLNDNGDLAYVSVASVPSFRFPTLEYNAVVGWRSGALDKIAAAGDPVPGFNGAVFDTEFGNARLNQAAAIFTSTMTPNGTPVWLLGRSQQGQLSILATGNDYIDGIGTLDTIGLPDFDTQQGPLVTFVASAAGGSELGLYAVTAAQQYTLRFTQIADGGGGASGGWRTTFVLANRSTTAANATIGFYGDTGAPLSLAVAGMQQTQTTVVVPALGVAQVQTQGGGPLTAGWALVQSDQNLTGIAIYGLLDGSGNSVTEVGSPAALPLLSSSVFTQTGATTNTGVALANPNPTPANVTLTLRDANSNQLSQTSVTIPAMGHLAKYANELFPGIPSGEFEGKIDIISTQSLAGLTLRQRGSVFTSLPVIP